MYRSVCLVVVICFAAACGHYNLGFCRTHLTHGGYNRSVTLDELVSDGDYTVLYTSGLRQFEEVRCAHLGFVYSEDGQSCKYYSYIEADGLKTWSVEKWVTLSKERRNKTLTAYEIHQLRSGSFHIIDKDDGYEDDTLQYIMYKKDGVMLIYWCNWIPTDTFDNNIWLIAVRTELAGSAESKEAVLEMLYHEEFRGLIDSDIEVFRHDARSFLKLGTCQG